MAIETNFDLWKSGWVVPGETHWELLPGAPPDAVNVYNKLFSAVGEEMYSVGGDCPVFFNEYKSDETFSEKNEEEKTASKLFDFENKEENK